MITIDDPEVLCLAGHVARESGACRTEALRETLRLKVHAARNTAAYLDRREEEWRRARARGEPAPPSLSAAERAERMEYGAPLHRHFPHLVPCRDREGPCGCAWSLKDEEIEALLAEVACGMSLDPADALRTVLRDRAVELRRTAEALASIGSTERGVRAHMLGEVVCITVGTARSPGRFRIPRWKKSRARWRGRWEGTSCPRFARRCWCAPIRRGKSRTRCCGWSGTSGPSSPRACEAR